MSQQNTVAVSNELSLPGPLTATPQWIHDEANTPSVAALSQTQFNVGLQDPKFEPPVGIFGVTAPESTGHNACMTVRSKSAEASIRYRALTGGASWHVGVGGNAGESTFFFWNDQNHIVVRIEKDGTVRVNKLVAAALEIDSALNAPKGLNAAGEVTIDAANMKLTNLPAAVSSSTLEHVMVDTATGKLSFQ